jgi:hypothetical protein
MAKQQTLLENEYNLNSNSSLGSLAMSGAKLGTAIERESRALVAQYNFATLGGAIGSVSLLDVNGNAAVLPTGAVVTSVIIDTITAPTSGGAATIALTSNSAADLKAATAIASYTGLIAGIPVGTAATSIKMTADRTVTATIATAALTAGKINVIINYVLSI